MAEVLVLEEEPSIARIIEFKLGREGHQVSCSASLQGLPPGLRPELVIAEAALAAASSRAFPETPLLVLYEPRRELVEVGQPMPKPFKPTVLARRVREMLERGRTAAEVPE